MRGAGSRTDGHVPLGATLETGDTTTTAEVVVSSVRAGTRPPDALAPRVGTPGVTRDYQRFSRPSPFHPLFEDCARYAGNSEIQRPRGFARDGETRTRTGDTTIFSRDLLALQFPRTAGDYVRSRCRIDVRVFADFAPASRALRPPARPVGLFATRLGGGHSVVEQETVMRQGVGRV